MVQARGVLQDFALRQLQRLSGLGLIGVALFGTASLATWNIADPSLNHATGNPVTNAMGAPGAVFADLATQIFGLGALPAMLPVAALGLTLAQGRHAGSGRARAMNAFLAVLVFCAAFACLSRPVTWPLPSGLGGLAGDMLMKLPAALLGGYPSGVTGAVVAALIAAPGLVLLARAMAPRLATAKSGAAHGDASGAAAARSAPKASHTSSPHSPPLASPFHEDNDDDDALDDDEGSPLIGAVVHHWLSFKSRLGLDRPRAGASRAARREPADGLDALAAARVNRERGIEPDMEVSRTQPPRPPVLRPQNRSHVPPMPSVADGPSFDEDDLVDELLAPDGPAAPARTAPARPVAVDAVAAPPKEGSRVKREAQGSLLKPDAYELPQLALLAQPKSVVRDQRLSKEALEENARVLEGVLEDFGVKGEIIHVRPGPVVTLYELEPAPGIKSSRVIGLADDIARSMSAIACRVAVVPGRNAIGIELPNESRETVYLREILAARDYETTKQRLALALGKTINGEPVIADLAKMPHLLVAGTTGSGKSVAINTMILSLLYRLTPEQCRLIMIDPKMLELSVYDGIPHLLTPVVTDPKKAVVALKWTVKEMEDRYRKMAKVGVRNIDGYNARVDEVQSKGERFSRTLQTGYDRDTGEAVYETEELDLEPMPYIVVIIDEMADLMMVAGKDIEGAVQRLAQMARAAGIHVVMATQRPSVDVITGTIKANFPTRISFQVTSKIDSRTILGEQGAEQLLGMGDMLFMAGGGRTQRVHGPFVSDNEVEAVVKHLKAQGVPQYLEAVTADDDEDDEDDDGGSPGSGSAAGGSYGDDSDDPYDQAVAVVLRDRKVSTSYIQRRLGIGYNRAATLIERMEKEGLISAPNHAGKRDILVPAEGETL
jgi:S-DNA-T family DNA segregation ATPase FtsK/SpoIIIE